MGGRGAAYDISQITNWLEHQDAYVGAAMPISPDDLPAGAGLGGIEDYIGSLGHEELFALDSGGNLVAAYRGTSHAVAFPAKLLGLKGGVVTHSHPAGLEEFGATMSFADVGNMLASDWAEHRAVSTAGGRMSYSMRRTAHADAAGLRRRMNRDIPGLNRQWQETYKQVYTQQAAAGAGRREARHRARLRAVGIINAYYRRVMPEYGFTYTTRRTR